MDATEDDELAGQMDGEATAAEQDESNDDEGADDDTTSVDTSVDTTADTTTSPLLPPPVTAITTTTRGSAPPSASRRTSGGGRRRRPLDEQSRERRRLSDRKRRERQRLAREAAAAEAAARHSPGGGAHASLPQPPLPLPWTPAAIQACLLAAGYTVDSSGSCSDASTTVLTLTWKCTREWALPRAVLTVSVQQPQRRRLLLPLAPLRAVESRMGRDTWVALAEASSHLQRGSWMLHPVEIVPAATATATAATATATAATATATAAATAVAAAAAAPSSMPPPSPSAPLLWWVFWLDVPRGCTGAELVELVGAACEGVQITLNRVPTLRDAAAAAMRAACACTVCRSNSSSTSASS